MTIRSLSRFFAATLLLPLLTGCFLTPQSGGQDTPPPPAP